MKRTGGEYAHSIGNNMTAPAISTRATLRVAACALAIAAADCACAQTFPDKPVRIVCPAAPGGISDLLSRIVAQRLTPLYGQQVIVDNRAGSGGHVAGDLVAKSAPDGYTLMQATIAHNAAYAMYSNLTYDPGKDLQPILLLGESQGVLVVHPSLPVRTVKEFVALARARPGELNYGSAGAGTAIHMAAELFKWVARVDLTHIAYKGSAPAMIDLIGGNIQLMFENVATASPHVKSGKVRALGVTGRQRVPNLPDIAPIAESGVPDYEAVPYYTLSTSSKVPADLVRKLAADVDAIVKSPELQQRWSELGITPLGGTPDAAIKRNTVETAKWSRVIKAANIHVD
jgi:tripartite-type tricarboxylate transporter receptor subunit TctC